MAKTKIEFEVEIPEGYEWTGEYREARPDELYLTRHPFVERWEGPGTSCSKYAIIRKAEVWKQLTPEKALEFMVSRQQVTLRHSVWRGTGRTQRQTIDKIYYMLGDLSISIPDQSHIHNVEYLEEV